MQLNAWQLNAQLCLRCFGSANDYTRGKSWYLKWSKLHQHSGGWSQA